MPELSTVAVLRNPSTGGCVLVHLNHRDELDTERAEEGGYELAGWLCHEQQYNSEGTDEVIDEAESDYDHEIPMFTDCLHNEGTEQKCDKMVMIIDDGAPSYCTTHEAEHEDEN